MRHISAFLAVSIVTVMHAGIAFAYIGPGPGLTMLGSLFTLVGGVIFALLLILIYPIRLMLKRRKQKKVAVDDTTANH